MSEETRSVRLPSGRVITNVPISATKSEIRDRAIEAGWATAADFGLPNPQPGAAGMDTTVAGSGFERGVMKPIHGAAQLLEAAVPDVIKEKITAVNNWLVDEGVPLARIPDGGVDQMVRDAEALYQDRRKRSGRGGADPMSVVGELASPANLAVAGPLSRLVHPVAQALGAITAGSIMSAVQPVTEGHVLAESGRAAEEGAYLGAATHGLMAGGGRILYPKAAERTAELRAEGIRPSPGQSLGGAWNTAEERLTSAVVLGDLVNSARSIPRDRLSLAVGNRALRPIGQRLPRGTQPGYEAAQRTRQMLNSAYDDLLNRPGIHVTMDPRFVNQVARIRSDYPALSDRHVRGLRVVFEEDVLGPFREWSLQHGSRVYIGGDTVKRIESRLTERLRRLGPRTGDSDGMYRNAIEDIRTAFRELVGRTNPDYAQELSRINLGWRNYAIMRRATANTTQSNGAFTPAELKRAAKSQDFSAHKAASSEQRSTLQEFANMAKDVLSDRTPTSGTTERALVNAVLLGGTVYNPNVAAAIGAVSAPYLPGMRTLASGLVAGRHPVLQAPARALPGLSPYGVPAMINADPFSTSEVRELQESLTR